MRTCLKSSFDYGDDTISFGPELRANGESERIVRTRRQTNRIMRYLICTVAFLAITSPAVAQSPGQAAQESDRGWVTLGFCNATSTDLGATANLGRTRAYQVGYHVSSDAVAGYTVRAVNASVGHSWVGRWSRVAGFVGPALSWGYDVHSATPGDGNARFTTVGAVANAQIIFTPVKELGIGTTFWGNLNSERSVGGVGVVLVFEGNK